MESSSQFTHMCGLPDGGFVAGIAEDQSQFTHMCGLPALLSSSTVLIVTVAIHAHVWVARQRTWRCLPTCCVAIHAHVWVARKRPAPCYNDGAGRNSRTCVGCQMISLGVEPVTDRRNSRTCVGCQYSELKEANAHEFPQSASLTAPSGGSPIHFQQKPHPSCLRQATFPKGEGWFTA